MVQSLVDIKRESDNKSAFEDLTGGGGSTYARSALLMENAAVPGVVTETTMGMAITNLVAPTAVSQAITNFQTMLPRNQHTIATAAGMTEKRASHTCCSRRSVGGGFRFETIFSILAANADVKWFFGLSSANAAMTNVNPSTLLNLIGFGKDSGDANFSLMSNDGTGAATKTALTNTGARASAINAAFKLELWCTPGEAEIDYKVTRIASDGTSAVDTGSIAADLPVIDTLFVPHLWTGNTTAVAATWQFSRLIVLPTPFAV